jgi:hypothetical protein
MLFINFEKPHRLRLQGIASVDDNDPLLSEYAEAQLIVRVSVSRVAKHVARALAPEHFKKDRCAAALIPIFYRVGADEWTLAIRSIANNCIREVK